MSYRFKGTNDGIDTVSMSKRSPSILVTDSRSYKNRSSAPFAGHAAAGSRADNGTSRGRSYRSLPSYLSPSKNALKRKPSGRFSNISIDSILSDTSDVPSGRREERRSSSLQERPSFLNDRLSNLNYSKTINPLPPRTSKTSQKLVLIPEDGDIHEGKQSFISDPRRASISQLANQKNQQLLQDKHLPRVTAYNVSDGFNLKSMADFMRNFHEVSPRLYDECLYVAYTLPLLSGKDGFRVKSNLSKKVVGGKTLLDKMIDTSEQRDHHYEYYSGVETVEDANKLDQEGKSASPAAGPMPSSTAPNESFDPSEPQFFAEETNTEQILRERKDPGVGSAAPKHEGDQHAEIFIFRYGVIVFWNFTELQEKNILGDIAFADQKIMVIRPLDEADIETEEFHLEYDKDAELPSIFNDIITLKSGDHIIELTLSHAIAQSSKLSRFESRITPILNSVTRLPKRLALYGTLGLKREQLLKRSGKLFKLRVDVNLSSSILDTPEFFWSSEPSLHPLYIAMREYLEIDQRVHVLNDRCMVFLEFFDICVDSVAERNMARVTWWFIVVIIVGVFFSITEILARFYIIRSHNNVIA